MLVIDRLTKKFTTPAGELIAVDNLTFTIAPSDIYALIGPNGAGKTTTIKIIVGLYRANSGKVTLFGEDITADDAKAKVAIGYVPDEPVFYPYLTAFEHLDFVRRLYNISEKTYKKSLEELLYLYPIGNILSSYPEHFSRGNKQKLSIIAALLHHPRILIMDEPIVGLDPESVETTAKILHDFAQNGGMVLLSTHTLSFVEKVAKRVGIIDNGKLIFEGSLSEVKKRGKAEKSLFSAFVSFTKKRHHFS
jgi:ABC-2 type transport system ATP-binding protein